MAGVISVIGPERRIELDPFDVEAWNLLLRDAQRRPIERARDFYERLVAQFPDAGRYWKVYIEHEAKNKCYENVEKLFGRCLEAVLNIDLWKCYVTYVRDTKGHLDAFRATMAKAYQFAISHVGIDLLSYPLYADYISFLKSVPVDGPKAEHDKIATIRSVYQQGVLTPIRNLEGLWGEYCAFEKSMNMNWTEKFIIEKSKDYQNARRVLREMDAMMRGLNRQHVSSPPKATAIVLKQVKLWKKYIDWEKTNPLNTVDGTVLKKRVIYAYKQALLCLGYHADVWYEAALYMQEAEVAPSEIVSLYDRATAGILRENILLHFAYADFEESRNNNEKVQAIYNKLLDMKNVDPTLAYIQYMKFTRRTEGIKSARGIFKRAREDARTKSQVFIAAALMEYYCSKDTSVAFKIFELGLKKFGAQSDFALAYIEFLSHLNEDNNTRVLFERILTSGNLPQENSLEVWDRYLEFESLVGDLNSILNVDKRRRESMDKEFSDVKTLLLIDRYKFMDLLPCPAEELRALGYTPTILGKNVLTNEKFSLSSMVKGGGGQSGSMGNASGGGGGGAGGGGPSTSGEMGFPRPDLQQMIPFKPKIVASTSHPVPGGIFPPPPAVAHFMMLLPPPFSFSGPFVGVDALMDRFREMTLPDDAPKPGVSSSSKGGTTDQQQHQNGGGTTSTATATAIETARMGEIKKEFYHLLATTVDPMQVLGQETGRKRPMARADSDDEGGDASSAAPAHDIYRSRRQLKKSTK